IELARDPPADLVDAAVAHRREATGAAEDLGALGVIDLAEVGAARNLIAMRREEALDAAEQESDATLAVGENKPSRGQPFAPPALDGFAGDGEALGDVVDVEHRLGQGCRRDIERLADAFDEQTQIMLKRG